MESLAGSSLRLGVIVVSGFYVALALSNFALIVGPAMAQGIEVPMAPAFGMMWNPAELMPDASWLVWAVLTIVLQLVSVVTKPPFRWLAIGLSIGCVAAMGDLARWTGPYAPLSTVLAIVNGAGPALGAIVFKKRTGT